MIVSNGVFNNVAAYLVSTHTKFLSFSCEFTMWMKGELDDEIMDGHRNHQKKNYFIR
jgi:hypothetical protein